MALYCQSSSTDLSTASKDNAINGQHIKAPYIRSMSLSLDGLDPAEIYTAAYCSVVKPIKSPEVVLERRKTSKRHLTKR